MTESRIYLVNQTSESNLDGPRYAILSLDLAAVQSLLREVGIATQAAAIHQCYGGYIQPTYHASWTADTPIFSETEDRWAADTMPLFWIRLPTTYVKPPVVTTYYHAVFVMPQGISFRCHRWDGVPVDTAELWREHLQLWERELSRAGRVPIGPAPVQRRRFIT